MFVQILVGTKVSDDTDSIQLHFNPGYACLPGQASPLVYERYYSEISEYVNDGMGPVRSASLPTTTHLAVSRAARRQTAPQGINFNTRQLVSTDQIHPMPGRVAVMNQDYEHYENEGMGPKLQLKHTKDQHDVAYTGLSGAEPALVLPDHTYAIPYESSTNLIV